MSTQQEDKFAGARENAKGWFASIEDMLEAFDKAETNNNDREAAERTIHESVLSVMVRDAWHAPGQPVEDAAEEYEILLSTGGPALRIYGKLDRWSQPESAELQMQDWFLPWTRYVCDEAKLVEFASKFYFGE
jgi:hypothetical protein